MNQFKQLIINMRRRYQNWIENNSVNFGSAAGIGITAWTIGAFLGQLSLEAQTTGWAVIIATLSAELGKEFVVGLVERMRDNDLNAEEISKTIQFELDKRQPLPDLQKIIEQAELLPTTLEIILRQSNFSLLANLQSEIAAYPQIISDQVALQLQPILNSQLDELKHRLDNLKNTNQQIFQILTSLVSTPSIALAPGSEPPLLVFISSLIGELSQERQVLQQAITSFGITKPWIFEYTPASSELIIQSYIEKVRQCDFFIILIDENISNAVENEFNEAIANQKPILALLKNDKDQKDHYRSPAARAVIQRIPSKVAKFSNLTELALQSRIALCDEINRRVRNGTMSLSEQSLRNIEKHEKRLSSTNLNLPPRRYTRLIGRIEDIEILHNKLCSSVPSDPSIVAITGLGGIGKTALAYELSSRAMVEGCFDGLVWESAKSEELESSNIVPTRSPVITKDSLLHSIASQIGYEKIANLSPNEREKQVRTLLLNRPYLIVIDNLETIDAYKDLVRYLEGFMLGKTHTPSRALLTSRERLFEIPYLFDYYVRGLSKQASFEFIQHEIETRVMGNLVIPENLRERIYLVTHGMPLAIKLIVSQYIAGIPLDTELDRLQKAKEDELYEFIYLRLWNKLNVPAKKILVSAASFGSSVSRSMLQPVSRASDEDFENAIPELIRLSLMEASDHAIQTERRYSIHPLTRWFINAPLRNHWQRSKDQSFN